MFVSVWPCDELPTENGYINIHCLGSHCRSLQVYFIKPLHFSMAVFFSRQSQAKPTDPSSIFTAGQAATKTRPLSTVDDAKPVQAKLFMALSLD